MYILVTGAAGFIGSHLAERLVTLGHKVRGVDSLNEHYSTDLKQLNVSQIQKAGVDFYPLDLAKDDITPAVKGVEVVFHLAAQPGLSQTTDFNTYVRNNISSTHQLLEAVNGEHTFRGFINISTSSVYGTNATGDETTAPAPTSFYGVTKLAAEQLVLSYYREQKLPACSTRLYSVYGPRERPEKLYPRLIGSILEGWKFPLYEGSEHNLRSFTYVDDIIDGLVSILDHFEVCTGEIFNLGTEEVHTTGEGIHTVEEIIGKPAEFIAQPRRPGDQLKTHANIDKARKLLGYSPSTTLREGLEKQVEWYKTEILGNINLWNNLPLKMHDEVH